MHPYFLYIGVETYLYFVRGRQPSGPPFTDYPFSFGLRTFQLLQTYYGYN
jgi:hypothetical protein